MAHPPISRTFTVVCGPIAADSHAHCYNDMAGDPYKITGVAESRNRGGHLFLMLVALDRRGTISYEDHAVFYGPNKG